MALHSISILFVLYSIDCQCIRQIPHHKTEFFYLDNTIRMLKNYTLAYFQYYKFDNSMENHANYYGFGFKFCSKLDCSNVSTIEFEC